MKTTLNPNVRCRLLSEKGAAFAERKATIAIRILLFATILPLAGCWTSSKPEVVVYSAQDAEFAQPIFAQFAETSGVVVRPKFDVESTKTVGLAEAIAAEKNRPRCDVFWNNEILHTLRLEKQGLLAAYRSPLAEKYPAAFRSADGLWHGFAARARVLLVNTKLVPEAERPKSIFDLADPRWKGRVGMAKPLFGTTATHAACLFAALGDEKAKEFYRNLKANDAQILSGNKRVAVSVAAGQLAFGMTDTDDAIVEVEKGMPVEIVYPDQEELTENSPAIGTLFIPNTLAVIRGCPHEADARRLVDYLLSPVVEKQLAEGPSAQIPLGENVEAKLRVKTPREIKAMQVDFESAAEKWDAAAKFLKNEFTGG
jgi:iron(III) transport system substrate-binding protein